MAELKELAEFYARAAAMKDPVIKVKGRKTETAVSTGPNMLCDISKWSVEERQPDFQCLIDSGIDCEFSNNDEFLNNPYISKLKKINTVSFTDARGATWRYCRPRLTHVHAWIATEDSKCPVPDGYDIRVHFEKVKGAPLFFDTSADLDWSAIDTNRITAFEVLPK